jgi:ABC-type transport system involved in cytochrome c biogenesis permease subunit
MTHTLAIATILFYIASTALNGVQLWRPSRKGKTSVATQALLYAGFVCHTATVLNVLLDPRYILLSNSADYFLWASWGLAVAFVGLGKRLSSPLIGAFIVPLIVLFMGCSSYLLHQAATSLIDKQSSDQVRGVVLPLLHAVPALFAFVSLVLALVVSAVYLIVEKRLKSKKRDVLDISAPNLQRLDALNRQLVQVSFVSISFVVLSGGLWAVSAQRPVFSDVVSVFSGIVTWILLALVLYLRLVKKCSNKQFARFALYVSGLFFLSVLFLLSASNRLSHGGV